MQCQRCASVVADTVTVCPKCGNALTALVDSYGATSFVPVMPAPQQTAHLSVRNPGTPQSPAAQEMGLASTMMVGSSPVPATMISGAPQSPGQYAPPRYVVTPAQGSPSPPQYQAPPPPTMQSMPMTPQPMQQGMQSAPMSPYAPPPMPLMYPAQSYPMQMMPQVVQQGGTPGLAVASLICGLLGWIPFWIGFILCLLAITFGGIVLAQTRPGQHGRGLAITGLVFGLILVLPAACGL